MSVPTAPLLAPSRLPKGGYCEPAVNWRSSGPWKRLAAAVVVLAFVAVCLVVAKVDPAALIKGLPRLFEWASTAWPPYAQELDVIAYRAFETVAIATVGTLAAALLAAPLAMLVANNTAPLPWLAMPLRWFANACRGIDTVVFAILFNTSLVVWHGELGRGTYSLIALATYLLLCAFIRAWLASGYTRGPMEMVWQWLIKLGSKQPAKPPVIEGPTS